MTSSGEIVTILKLNDPIKAHYLQDVLADRGIPCLIDNQGQAASPGALGAFGIRLQVLEPRVEDAKAVLIEIGEIDAD